MNIDLSHFNKRTYSFLWDYDMRAGLRFSSCKCRFLGHLCLRNHRNKHGGIGHGTF
jgi:hypothetical protein